jgi:pSer/pThr/pTyr-binding forkhead associated (FHA) protein
MKELKIGRSLDNNIVLDDESVSRHHAIIFQNVNQQFSIIDHNSTNGTFINGVRIYGTRQMEYNDILKIGNSILPWRNYFQISKENRSETLLNSNQVQSIKSHKILEVNDWLVIYLIMIIPVINLVFLIVWATDNMNMARKKWAMASLIWMAIMIGLMFIFYLFIFATYFKRF